MSFGDSDTLLRLAKRYGLVTIDAACAVSGLSPNAAVKRLMTLSARRELAKSPYIHPRCYWHPRRPLGAQSLTLASSVLYRCVLAESRTWTPEGRDGPATIIAREGEREALFVDYGASPRHVTAKLANWCDARDMARFSALGVVVPSEEKARAINEAIEDLPFPVRYTVSEDLWGLICEKVRP